MPGSSIRPYEVPFAGGYQQKTAEPWVDASAQADDVNVIWVKKPAPEKRPGYLGLTRSITTPGIVNGGNWFNPTLSTIAGFLPDQNGVCATDGTHIYTFSASNRWQWADYASQFVATRKTVASSEVSVFNPDVADYAAGDVRVFVWEDGVASNVTNVQIRYALKSISTGAVIATGIVDKNTTGLHPRVFVLGGNAFVLWGEFVHGSAGHVYYSSAPLSVGSGGPFGSGLNWQSAAALVSNRVDFGATQGGAWDAVAADDGSGLVLVYENTAHQIVVQKYKINTPNTLQVDGSLAVVANETGTLFNCLGARWSVASDTIWIGIGWSSDNRAQAVSFKGSTLVQQIGSPVAIQLPGFTFACRAIAVEDIGGVGWFVWGNGDEGSYMRSASVTQPGGAIAQGVQSFNLQPASRPFAQTCTDGGNAQRLYVWACTGRNDPATNIAQNLTQVLCEADVTGVQAQFRPVASVAPRRISSNTANVGTAAIRKGGSLSSVTGLGVPGQTKRSYAGVISENFFSTSYNGSLLLLDVTADAAHPGRAQASALGGLTYVGGGLPGTFDGSTFVELGTISDPTMLNGGADIVDAGVGGALIDNVGPYQWVFVYEWVDHQGNLHRGQPSLPQSHKLAVGQHSVTLTIPCLSLTKKGLEFREAEFGDSLLQIGIYRTAWNAVLSTMSETLYFVGYVHNDDTQPTLTHVDAVADATIVAAKFILPLYTTGGVLEADMPPSFSAICTHQNRVYGIGDDLRTIWISTEVEQGGPVRFNDGSQLLINDIGDLTAIWSLDGNLFFASADKIGFVSGAGPSDTGAQNDLSTPTILPGDVGVIDPRVVCLIPAGFVFAHRYGLGLLDRSLSVHSDFGDPVEDLLTGATVTSITLHPTRPEVIVCAANPVVGRTLCFNYRFNAWSYWTVYDPAWQAVHHSSVPWVASTTINGVLYGATPGGSVFSERGVSDAARYWDTLDAVAPHYVPMTASTAWIKPAGALQGWGRVNYLELLWGVQDWHNLTATIAYDYNPSTVTTLSPGTIASSTITTFPDVQGSTGVVTRFQFHPSTSKCSAFRVSFSDSAPLTAPTAVSGQGPRLLAVTAGLRPSGAGLYRTPEAQRG